MSEETNKIFEKTLSYMYTCMGTEHMYGYLLYIYVHEYIQCIRAYIYIQYNYSL